MANAIVLMPGFMGSRLAPESGDPLIWVDPLWLATHVEDFVTGMTLRTPENPRLLPDGVLHDVDVDDLIRVGIYREFHQFAIDPKGLGLDPSDYHEFAFDWRKSVAEAAQSLDDMLAGVANPPITLVAHSSGGLVAAALFAQGGPGSKRVGKLVAVGCPFAGLLKTIEMIEEGSGILTLFFKGDPIRQLLGGWPQAYELMPALADAGLFSDAAGRASTPFLSAAAMLGGRYDPALLAAAARVVSTFKLKFPVPVRLIAGFGVSTSVSAQLQGAKIAVQRSIQGDGTCPERSLLAASGTAAGAVAGTRVFSLPFGEHVELIRDQTVLDYLRDDLCGGVPTPQITARVSGQLPIPGVDNLLVVETRDANGQPLGATPTAKCTDGMVIPLKPDPVAGQARWLGSFQHPLAFTSIIVTVPGLPDEEQPPPIHVIP